MEFFNVGWPELVFIFVLAFIVLGPDRMSRTAKDFGRWFSRMKKNETFRDVIKTTDKIRTYPGKLMQELRFEDDIRSDPEKAESYELEEHPMMNHGSMRPKINSGSEVRHDSGPAEKTY